MAEKRMLSKVISVSKKVNLRISNHFTRLFYTWLIPHTDDFGRLTGCPHKLRALIIPMLSETHEDVEKSLMELHNIDLIKWYEVNGEQYLQVINFEEHQQGLHKRTQSKIPDPPDISRKFPEIPSELKGTELELNRTELKELEQEQKGIERPTHNFLPLINKLNLKCKGIYESEKVEDYLTTMTVELIEEALKRSEFKKSVAYALGILSDWESSGFKILEDVKPKNNVRHFNRGSTGTSGKKSIPINNTPSTSEPLSDDRRAALRLTASLMDKKITQEEYDEQILQYKPKALP